MRIISSYESQSITNVLCPWTFLYILACTCLAEKTMFLLLETFSDCKNFKTTLRLSKRHDYRDITNRNKDRIRSAEFQTCTRIALKIAPLGHHYVGVQWRYRQTKCLLIHIKQDICNSKLSCSLDRTLGTYLLSLVPHSLLVLVVVPCLDPRELAQCQKTPRKPPTSAGSLLCPTN